MLPENASLETGVRTSEPKISGIKGHFKKHQAGCFASQYCPKTEITSRWTWLSTVALPCVIQETVENMRLYYSMIYKNISDITRHIP